MGGGESISQKKLTQKTRSKPDMNPILAELAQLFDMTILAHVPLFRARPFNLLTFTTLPQSRIQNL